MPSAKICHITSVHKSSDGRIFAKQCRSAAAAGFDTYLVATNGESRVEDGVTVVAVQTPARGRLRRMWDSVNAVCEAAMDLQADIYQLHDPELLRVARRLQRTGAKVIYDVHEDVPKQILGKHWINRSLRGVISASFKSFEEHTASRLDHVITATPTIRDRFLRINPNTTDINNFPRLEGFATPPQWRDKRREACYVGGIEKIRGLSELVAAMAETEDIQLNLAGTISPAAYRAELTAMRGWSRINEVGFIPPSAVREVMARSMVGLVTFLPYPNHVDSRPTKMFEYMSSGLPVIASNFELWKSIVDEANCGICVDPTNPDAIASAITDLVDNPQRAEELGENGRRAAEQKYNWTIEARKLVTLYREVLGQR